MQEGIGGKTTDFCTTQQWLIATVNCWLTVCIKKLLSPTSKSWPMEPKPGLCPLPPAHTHSPLGSHSNCFCAVPASQLTKKKKILKNKQTNIACIQASPFKRHRFKKKKKIIVMLLPQIKCKNQAVSKYKHIPTHTHTCVHVYIY